MRRKKSFWSSTIYAHSKPVKAWLAERTDRIEVFYLPSYAPDLNPDERLHADMKHAIGAKVPVPFPGGS